MTKVIAGINVTLDGFCDHTAIIPNEEIHDHYAELLSKAGTILYGRITYQLMQYWQTLIKTPSGERSMDEFAKVMDSLPKIVFSHTLKDPEWETAKLANRPIEDEVLAIRQQSGKDILVGSRSLIIQLMKLSLIDELQLCVHPIIAGKGLPLFENLQDRINLKLSKTKTLSSGAIILYYEQIKNSPNLTHIH
ncbi:MAG: dihydrofolate reductase family protein [Pedobacter sp.]|uniref:dihydrofolate reductase family protein n=1 Tax=Pedobacter sp. TaxID=1411316 RepID=UPI003569C046